MKRMSLKLSPIILSVCLLVMGFAVFNYENNDNVAKAFSLPQTFDTTIKALDYGETAVVNNTLVFINFSGETNTLNIKNTLYDAYPYEVIEDTYNNSEYSVKSYFETTSNGKLSLRTNFLYNGTYGTPFTISYSRDYFITGSGSTFTLTNAIWEAIKTDFIEYAKDYDLDANDDGYVDSLTFLLTPDPEGRTVGWSTPLWAHSSTMTNLASVTDNSGSSITLGKYNLATVEIVDYKDGMIEQDPLVDSNGIKIAESSTYCHELSHVLGLPDYYIYDTMFDNTLVDSEEVPVGVWDLMAYNYYQMPQHSLAYNKLQMGYIEESNVVEITENNTYELYPVSYWETHDITSLDVSAYFVRGKGEYSNQYFYIEYRSQDGLFDSKLPTSGLVVYRVDTNITSSYFTGVSAGNFMAPPYNIQIMRNEIISPITDTDLSYLGQGYAKMYTANNGRNFSYYKPSLKGAESLIATGLDGHGLASIGNSIDGQAKVGVTSNYCNGHMVSLTWQSGDITYQKYTGTNQGNIAPEDIEYINTGIVIDVLEITEDGKLKFQIDWQELSDPEVEEEDVLIDSSLFEDVNLYNKLLDIISKDKGMVVNELYRNDFKNFNVLDLSNSKISSVVGLEQLNLSNLRIINLMQNSLTNNSLTALNNLINLYQNIEHINLNLNNLLLQDSNIDDLIKENTKFIFGFQNVSATLNSLNYYFNSDAHTKILEYYFNDDSVLNTSFGTEYKEINNDTTLPSYYEYNVVFNDSNLGTNFTIKFYIIKVNVSHVNIERNSPFTNGVVISGINSSLVTISTSSVSTIKETQNVSVTYKITIKNQPSIYRTYESTYSVIDTISPIIKSSLASEKQNIVIGTTFNIQDVLFTVEDNGIAETDYVLQYGEYSNQSKKTVFYKIEKLLDGAWTSVNDINTDKIDEEYRILLVAVDNSGNVSQELVINYLIVPSSILTVTDFANATLYQSLLTIAEQNDNQILYPEVFKGVNFIDLSNLGLTSFSGMEKFSFDVNTVIDLSNNKLSDISSISSFVNKNEITIVLLFNEISNIEEASNFVYGMQNLKTKYINEKPVIGQNLLINDDYSEIFDYTISKDVSSSHGMSMLSSSIEAFNEYGTYKITFTYKTNSQISHSIKIQYGNISLRNQTYNQEAGYPFSKDDIIFNGIEVSDYTYQLRNVPQGDLEIGTFNVTYDIYKKEDGEKVVSLSQTVVVADTISPTITIIGNEEVYTYLGNNYVDKGARAYDSYDAQPIVVTEGSVDTTKIGEYSITYYAKDSSGNESVRRIRIVNVIYYPISGIQVDVEKSYYTGETANLNITPIVPLGKENYLDPNLKYFLYINDDIVEGSVNSYTFNEAGTYKLEVKALTTDSSGNSKVVSSDTFTIIVKDMSFLEKYGVYMISGLAGFIVVSLIIYFASRRKDNII